MCGFNPPDGQCFGGREGSFCKTKSDCHDDMECYYGNDYYICCNDGYISGYVYSYCNLNKPNGQSCAVNEQCESGRCSWGHLCY